MRVISCDKSWKIENIIEDRFDRLDVVVEENESDYDYGSVLDNCEDCHEEILGPNLYLEQIEITGIE